MSIQEIYSKFLESTGISIDSRSISKGNIFFAIKGEHFDGNTYAVKAIELGASYSFVSDSSLINDKIIYVQDTLKCLQALSTYHRNTIGIPVLALTGSNGKTTTKELIAHVLSKKYSLQYTSGNLNNHLGVPLTLLSFSENTELGIVEMGANHVGEIAELCEIAQPDFGLITNIGKAHIGEFGGFENIIIAKTEMYQFLIKNHGLIFYNKEDKILSPLAENSEKRIAFSTSFENGMSLSVEKIEPEIDLELKFTDGKDIKFHVGLSGKHNVENIKVAIAVGLYFGLSGDEIAFQLSTFKAPNNRSQWLETSRNQIFLDAYNANPSSIKSVIEYFSQLSSKRKLLIIGDMHELGLYTDEEHLNVYNQLVESKMEFYLIGQNFKKIAIDDRIFLSKEAMLNEVDFKMFTDYKILLKASRGLKLETLKDFI